MKIIYMNALKKKLKMSDQMLDITYELLEKLRLCGYISNSREMDLVDNLYQNVNKIVIGTNESEDIKSGYYDAPKKELYIRDIEDKKAVYQRLIYAMTAKKVSSSKYMVGFSYTTKQKSSYKYNYEGFGFNRAVVADLASKLCNITEEDMKIKILYKTYKLNFLGYDVISENDNYLLESNLFKQLCFAINEKKDRIYKMLFDRTPINSIEKMFKVSEFDSKTYMSLFDKISKKYSNYNKILSYVNELDNNYAKLQRLTGRTDEEIKELENSNKKLNSVIKATVRKYSKVKEDEEETNVNEFLENAENEIVDSIIKMQDMLVDYLSDDTVINEPYEFASRLKQFNDAIIIKNDKLEDLIFDVITTKLLKSNEVTSVNLIEKIKYSLVNEIISTDKFKDIYSDLKFKTIHGTSTENSEYIIILSNNQVAKCVKVENTNMPIRSMESNTSVINLDNFKHVLNTDYFNPEIPKLEKIYTALKSRYSYFSSLPIENIDYFNDEEKMLLIVSYKNMIYPLEVSEKNSRFKIRKLEISETYSLFKQSSIEKISNLPVLYKEKKGIFALFDKFRMIFANN